MKPTFIFVHPIMSIELMFQTVKYKGYKIFTIITTFESQHLNMEILNFYSDFIFTGSNSPEKDITYIHQIISEQKFSVKGLINGLDASIYYADFLQKDILGYDIDLNSSKVRLNKYAVNIALQEKGIASIPSVEVVSNEDLITKADEIRKLEFPIVAKPAENTAAMSGVEFIYSLDELYSYMNRNLNKPNPYYSDNIINKVVLQKYIPEDKFNEFIIDFISYGGKHYCVGIAHFGNEIKENKYKIVRYYIPDTIDDYPKIRPLIEYVKNCLTALNVRYGFTHNELFWDHESQYHLIEINNRMAGGGMQEAYYNSYGNYPLTQYLNFLEGKPVIDIPNKRKSYSLVMHLYNLFVEGADQLCIKDINSFEKIVTFSLHSKQDANFYRNYTRANNINACILLNNSSKEELEKDIQTILSHEADGTLFFKSG
jgi:hypothetical protein